ncbi:MAG: hypothetical protein HGA85_08405, partial [Nanoarchaeota archaeon]|nr:hypothetical protein [Nanoarchaeota archaeon]
MEISKGMKEFVIRTGILALAVISAYLFVFLFFRHTQFFVDYLQLSDEYYIGFLTGLSKTDFLNSVLFTLVIFFIYNRLAIKELKPYAQDWKETILFSAFAILNSIVFPGSPEMVYYNRFWIISPVMVVSI